MTASAGVGSHSWFRVPSSLFRVEFQIVLSIASPPPVPGMRGTEERGTRNPEPNPARGTRHPAPLCSQSRRFRWSPNRKASAASVSVGLALDADGNTDDESTYRFWHS